VQNPWELDDYYSKERIEVFTAKRKQFRYLCKLLLGHKRELDICADRKGPAAVFVNVNPINKEYAILRRRRKG
jgi:hypothetical protein